MTAETPRPATIKLALDAIDRELRDVGRSSRERAYILDRRHQVKQALDKALKAEAIERGW